jgi:hypothetical protein
MAQLEEIPIKPALPPLYFSQKGWAAAEQDWKYPQSTGQF